MLGPDRQTEFSRASCPSDGAIPFGFPFGLPAANGFFFHVDPGPPPLEMYWNYTASNSANLLRIDGLVGIAAGGCSDMPTRFSHSNVLAVLVPPPRLTVLGFATNHAARLMIQGNAGQTNLVEASVDLKTWVPVSTNVRTTVTPHCVHSRFSRTRKAPTPFIASTEFRKFTEANSLLDVSPSSRICARASTLSRLRANRLKFKIRSETISAMKRKDSRAQHTCVWGQGFPVPRRKAPATLLSKRFGQPRPRRRLSRFSAARVDWAAYRPWMGSCQPSPGPR